MPPFSPPHSYCIFYLRLQSLLCQTIGCDTSMIRGSLPCLITYVFLFAIPFCFLNVIACAILLFLFSFCFLEIFIHLHCCWNTTIPPLWDKKRHSLLYIFIRSRFGFPFSGFALLLPYSQCFLLCRCHLGICISARLCFFCVPSHLSIWPYD